ncbi:hypothetical protein TNCV_2099061 [Trichonephila clavipes]|nr:hypothetical protein TNCV_2099061 [Trichonephila clavipes]
MVSCGISCQICSNCRTKSSTFPGRCSRLPIIPKTCSIGEGSGNLYGQGSVWGPASKEMTPQAIIPCLGPVWYVIVKAGSGHAALAISRHVFDDRQDTDGSGIRL